MNTIIEPFGSEEALEEESLDTIFMTIEAEFTGIIELCDKLLSDLIKIRNRISEMELYIDDMPAPEWINKQYLEFQGDITHEISWGKYLIERLQGLHVCE
jgi:hypothetical protein